MVVVTKRTFGGRDISLTRYRQVQVMSTLPLKGISRIWGRFNELQIPYYLRVPGFKLYSWIFGVKYVCEAPLTASADPTTVSLR